MLVLPPSLPTWSGLSVAVRAIRCPDGGLRVSDLIPNLEDLRAQLPTDGTAQDAHEFVAELATVVSAEDVDMKIDAVDHNGR